MVAVVDFLLQLPLPLVAVSELIPHHWKSAFAEVEEKQHLQLDEIAVLVVEMKKKFDFERTKQSQSEMRMELIMTKHRNMSKRVPKKRDEITRDEITEI